MTKPDSPRLRSCLLAATWMAFLAGLPLDARAADWPQYRGPGRDGRSAETGLLKSWPESGPEVLWRTPLGSGYSGIAVAGGRVFTMFGVEGDEYAGAFEASTGKPLWRFRMARNRRDGQGDGPRATPTVDGELAYFMGAGANLFALDVATGEPRWGSDLPEELGAKVPQWGVATSPLVEGKMLIVDVAGRRDHGIVAFDKKSGEIIWHAGHHRPAYSSPLAVTIGGDRQLVIFHAEGLVGISAADGGPLWRVPWSTSYDVNAAMPVFVPRSGIFISSGYDTGAGLFQVVSEKEQFQVYQVWRNRVMKNHFNSSVLVGRFIYGFDMSTLKCIDAGSGEEKWRARGGFSKGSLLYADGHLIVLGGNGNLGLVEATPEEFRRKAHARILESKTWTMPSLSDGSLYVRDFSEMVALKVGS